ncbi:hypothetical protein XENOCAPTIV_028574 [Xenoophorus captivus]|uniref:Uncharacterized protein n=1 Tax=Xenoophorus captivus TaxID=1517983 RepID=A0ABV0SDQ4_9TELE
MSAKLNKLEEWDKIIKGWCRESQTGKPLLIFSIEHYFGFFCLHFFLFSFFKINSFTTHQVSCFRAVFFQLGNKHLLSLLETVPKQNAKLLHTQIPSSFYCKLL